MTELQHVKKLVNFCLVTPEMIGLICIPTYMHWAKIEINTHSFIVLSFRNATEYWNADGHINSGDYHTTNGTNLVSF